MEEFEIQNGCLWEWHKESDFLLAEGDADWLPTLYMQDEIYYEYNQGNQSWSQKSCTIFDAVGAVSDLFNYEYELNEIKDYDAESYTKGRVKGAGWYVWFAVDLVRNRRNNDPEKVKKYGKVATYYVNMKDDATVKKILEKITQSQLDIIETQIITTTLKRMQYWTVQVLDHKLMATQQTL